MNCFSQVIDTYNRTVTVASADADNMAGIEANTEISSSGYLRWSARAGGTTMDVTNYVVFDNVTLKDRTPLRLLEWMK